MLQEFRVLRIPPLLRSDLRWRERGRIRRPPGRRARRRGWPDHRRGAGRTPDRAEPERASVPVHRPVVHRRARCCREGMPRKPVHPSTEVSIAVRERRRPAAGRDHHREELAHHDRDPEVLRRRHGARSERWMCHQQIGLAEDPEQLSRCRGWVCDEASPHPVATQTHLVQPRAPHEPFVLWISTHACWREVERVRGEVERLARQGRVEPAGRQERHLVPEFHQPIRRSDERGDVAEERGRAEHDPGHRIRSTGSAAEQPPGCADEDTIDGAVVHPRPSGAVVRVGQPPGRVTAGRASHRASP